MLSHLWGLAGWGEIVPPQGGELLPTDSRQLPCKHAYCVQTNQSGARTRIHLPVWLSHEPVLPLP